VRGSTASGREVSEQTGLSFFEWLDRWRPDDDLKSNIQVSMFVSNWGERGAKKIKQESSPCQRTTMLKLPLITRDAVDSKS
jgi:hypothetical protein